MSKFFKAKPKEIFIAYLACSGFAMPCYADQISDPVTIPVTVTVSSVVLCTETGYCGDTEMIIITEGEE